MSLSEHNDSYPEPDDRLGTHVPIKLVPGLTLKLKALSLITQQEDHISKHIQSKILIEHRYAQFKPDESQMMRLLISDIMADVKDKKICLN